jgi:hypothetical protein
MCVRGIERAGSGQMTELCSRTLTTQWIPGWEWVEGDCARVITWFRRRLSGRLIWRVGWRVCEIWLGT